MRGFQRFAALITDPGIILSVRQKLSGALRGVGKSVPPHALTLLAVTVHHRAQQAAPLAATHLR